MFGEIAKKNPNELMAFKHLGVVKEGKAQPLDETTKKWSGFVPAGFLPTSHYEL